VSGVVVWYSGQGSEAKTFVNGDFSQGAGYVDLMDISGLK
jgi:hypothetical protein